MVYLDSAATTLQKPPAVSRAMERACRTMASVGRGGHRPAMEAAETAFACRQVAAELFHMEDPARVVFAFNATHALNLAIKSVVSPGDTVVVSGYEHNAVTRPLHALGCQVRVATSPLFRPEEIYAAFEAAITGEVSCVICTYVSNVFGYVLPVEKIAALCRERGVPFILDASQGAGALPVHMDRLPEDSFVGMPGHKGLYGPQGTGLLLCGEKARPRHLMEGGTGSLSALQEMPDFLPDALEAGTHNIPGIAGLLEGLSYVKGREADILAHERVLIRLAARGLGELDGVTVYAAEDPAAQAGVLSFQVEGLDCESVGAELGSRDIVVRAGLHCAPYAHRSAGTLEQGTVRMSVSAFNTREDIQALVAAVAELRRGI